MVLSLFDFILSLLLLFNPSISDSAFNQVYTMLDDTELRSVLVEDSAVELLSQFANDGIMPLDFGTTDSGNLKNIADRLYTGGNSAAQWLQTIYQSIGSANSTARSSVLGYLYHLDDAASDISKFLTSTSQDAYSPGLVGLLQKLTMMFGSDSINGYPRQTMLAAQSILTKLNGISDKGGWDSRFSSNLFNFDDFSWKEAEFTPFGALVSILNTLSSTFSLPAGSMVMGSNGVPYEAGNSRTIASWLHDDLMGTASLMRVGSGWQVLNAHGAVVDGAEGTSFTSLFNRSFLGFAHLLRGGDGTADFYMLSEDLSSTTEKHTTDLFDTLAYGFSQLQNPLQKLAFVFASDQDLEIRKDVSDNLDQAQEDFFKPDGGGSVKPSNIKDAAGISGGAAGALQSPGSVGDVTGQINNADNFSFFSQLTLGNLDSVPVTAAAGEDDFIDFYDPSNPALWEALR